VTNAIYYDDKGINKVTEILYSLGGRVKIVLQSTEVVDSKQSLVLPNNHKKSTAVNYGKNITY